MKKLQVGAFLLFSVSCALAGTVSLGTVSTRGDLKVDGYTVHGNATIFDGSVIETGQTIADVRIGEKGSVVTLADHSRGIVYHNRFVLQSGKCKFATLPSFAVEANGLGLTASAPNSSGIAALAESSTVHLAAIAGSVAVTNSLGAVIRNVVPGQPAFLTKNGTVAGKGPGVSFSSQDTTFKWCFPWPFCCSR